MRRSLEKKPQAWADGTPVLFFNRCKSTVDIATVTHNVDADGLVIEIDIAQDPMRAHTDFLPVAKVGERFEAVAAFGHILGLLNDPNRNGFIQFL
jgi:hypothetical protein